MIKGIFILICLVVFIVKMISSAMRKRSAKGLFQKAKTRPEFAQELSEDISLFYAKKDYQNFNLQSFKSKVDQRNYGKYKVVDSIETPGRLLLFTQRKDEDFGIKWNGRAGDVKKEQYDFFVVANDTENKKATIYGQHYTDLNDKVLKTEFAQALIEEVG